MINEQIDVEFIDKIDRSIQSYKKLIVEVGTQKAQIAKLKNQIAGLLEQCKQWKMKYAELEKETNKANFDLDKFEDYVRSVIQSFFDTHVNENDKYLLRKIEESFMQRLRSKYCETSDADIKVTCDR